MIFIDKEGVTFTVDNTPKKPGWQTQEAPFVLWFEPRNLSCKLYYVLPVRILADAQPGLALTIDIGSSDTFSILPASMLRAVNIRVSDIRRKTKTVIIPDRDNYRSCFPLSVSDESTPSKYLFTVYFLARHDIEETVLKNVKFTLRAWNKVIDSTVARIGGIFRDDSQELLVNGANMGIKLPADICKAFWNCGYTEYYPDRVEQRNKLKELLFNYMGIKGRCGSYESVLNSLKWFGWGEHVTLQQLVTLNEEISGMFLTKEFDRPSEPGIWFENFRRTTFLSLKSFIRKCAGAGEPADVPLEGSWNPDSEVNPVYAVESEDGPVWKWNEELFENNDRFTGVFNEINPETRYDYIFTELGLKLACLAAIYEEQFLPVQLNVVSSSVVDTVSSAPLKLLCGTAVHANQTIDAVTQHEITVKFPKRKFTVYWNMLKTFVDITFDVYGAKTGSFSAYVSSVRNKHVTPIYSVMDAFEGGIGKITVPLSDFTEDTENPIDIKNIKYLSVLIDGRWFETEIKITYPKILLTPGTLQYRYPDEISEDLETDLFITKSLQKYSSEFSSSSSDTGICESVSGLTEINPYIPLSKMNLVIICDILDTEMYSSRLGISGILKHVKIMFGGNDVSDDFDIYIIKNEDYEEGKINKGTPYFIYAAAKYPLYLWEESRLSDAGISSLSTEFLERWLRKSGIFKINAPYSLGKISLELKWFVERFHFTEPKPGIDGWTDYTFYKDDLVACKISGFPYVPPFHEKDHRIVFRRISDETSLKTELNGDTEIVMLPRSGSHEKYLRPGTYDCELNFAHGSATTVTTSKSGAFKIIDRIDSRLIKDIKPI